MDHDREATVFGPFFVEDAPHAGLGGDIGGGAPVPHAPRIEVWEADEEGLYDVQHGDGRVYGRAHLFSDENGAFRFWALTPTPTRSRTTGPSAGCSTRPGAPPTAPRTCTSWSAPRATAPS
ncbi:hypothetical protein ACFQXA_09060 [Nocardiopsis composta]